MFLNSLDTQVLELDAAREDFRLRMLRLESEAYERVHIRGLPA